ncbi:MAG: protein-disulfide reductase DsbD family protein [Lishizhenia sp.]
MKILLTLITLLTVTTTIFAQPSGAWFEKIEWEFSVRNDGENNATIIANAKLADGWHVFSINHDPVKADYTGVPTTFNFKANPKYKLRGKAYDGAKAKEHTDVLGTSVYFEKKAVFKQKIELLQEGSFDIDVEYEFQVCDENGCLFPPAQEATITIPANYFVSNNLKDEAVEEPQSDSTTDELIADEEILPKEDSTASQTLLSNEKEVKTSEEIKDNRTVKKQEDEEEKGSMWTIFFKCFAAGIIALLTPCVFPMIPMTVTFFTKQSKSRSAGIKNAILYGVSIIAIYVALGLIVTAIAGPTGLNEMSTNVYMNLIFFFIFIIFAISFLGAFEIRMPAKWVNKADSKADKGGFIGIFFMAFVLALVSFSCTGPIIGSLLVDSSGATSSWAPTIGMLGFGIALSLPFTLFAIFPGWLNSLPQSGGWLNSVKVVLGLLELALALKFLSMVDLAYHWDILTREVFVALWIVIFTIMGIYLLGKIRFSHDSVVEKLSVTRFFFALFALTFAVYLLPGMWGAPLYMIDGVAPPRTHSEDNFRFVRGSGTAQNASTGDPIFMEYREHMHEVGDGSILVFHEMDIAKEYAEKVNKPLMLDFTGYACANCRKTESKVWTDNEIRPLLQNDVVIVSLYCDDKKLLPEDEWYYSEAIRGKVKTVGNKWSDYQVKNYGANAQPLYIIQDLEGNDLTEAIGYTPDITEYKEFMMGGINKFKKK